MKIKKLEIPEKILKDKRIKPECKIIYEYIFTKGFERIITDLNIGEIQQVVKITNQGLKRNLEKLEKFEYLVFKEYDTGMYQIHLQDC